MLLGFIAVSVGYPQSVRFTTDGSALIVDGQSYPLVEPRTFAFEGGVIRSLGPGRLVWTVGGQVKGFYSFAANVIPWLKQAGVHTVSGTRFALTQCLALPFGSALGVVTVRSPHSIMLDEGAGPSPEVEFPVVAQFLVRVGSRPFRLELLRSLVPAGNSVPLDGYEVDDTFRDPVRLIQLRGRIYCIGNGTVDLIDSSGYSIPTRVRWGMKTEPLGVSGDRWILGQAYTSSAYELWATDMVRGKTFCAYRHRRSDPPFNCNPYVEFAGTSPTSDYVLIEASEGSNTPGGGGQDAFTLHLPDGKRQSMTKIWPFAVWGPYVVGGDPKSGNHQESLRLAVFYTAATGHLAHLYMR